MTNNRPDEITRRYFLTAGETDAEGRMPMALIFERCIEIATGHANILGIGYDALITKGVGWVLTRMTVEMEQYPCINQEYSLTTWIEGFNRLYSDRCFMICDAQGRTIGNMRSMWVAIDMHKRTASDLTQFEKDLPLSKRQCPVPMQRKLRELPEVDRTSKYRFCFSDLDFNRHVNTVMYVRHLLNQWSLDHYDQKQIRQFAIAFHKECYYGEEVDINVCEIADESICEIAHQGQRCIIATIAWQDRKQLNNL